MMFIRDLEGLRLGLLVPKRRQLTHATLERIDGLTAQLDRIEMALRQKR